LLGGAVTVVGVGAWATASRESGDDGTGAEGVGKEMRERDDRGHGAIRVSLETHFLLGFQTFFRVCLSLASKLELNIQRGFPKGVEIGKLT